MAMYEYRCQGCGRKVMSDERGDQVVTRCCGQIGNRVWAFSVASVMQEHWNQTLGAPVSSMAGFKEGLKIKSEEASERTGIDHNFQPVDLTDTRGLGVTEEGLAG